jgi:hypothetical protein
MRPMPRRLSEIQISSSPGQRRLSARPAHLDGDALAVDFSHGDVDAFPPHPAAEAADRVQAHRAIRDRILRILGTLEGSRVRTPEAGSYLSVRLPELKVPAGDFIRELADTEAVVVTPGSEFGAGFDDFFRINFSQDADAAAAAIERLVRLAQLRRADDADRAPRTTP